MELLKLSYNLFLLILRRHEWEKDRGFLFFLQTLGKLKQDGAVGGEEVLGEVLTQLAGRYAAILVLFAPAHKTGGCVFLFHHPIPPVWIVLAVSLKSIQTITCRLFVWQREGKCTKTGNGILR